MSNKKSKTDENEVDESTLEIFNEVEEVQKEIEEFEQKKDLELAEIEFKFQKEKRPLILKRNKIFEKLPEFWGTAMTQHPVLKEFITEKDAELLKSLKELDCEFLDKFGSYKITLKFNPNNFLESLTIWKEFRLTTEGDCETKTSSLKWKAGKDLTAKNFDDSSVGNKRSHEEIDESFFSFFQDEDQAEMDHQEVSSFIRDEIWVDPMKYFRGEDDQDDDQEGDEEEEEEDEEEDDAE